MRGPRLGPSVVRTGGPDRGTFPHRPPGNFSGEVPFPGSRSGEDPRRTPRSRDSEDPDCFRGKTDTVGLRGDTKHGLCGLRRTSRLSSTVVPRGPETIPPRARRGTVCETSLESLGALLFQILN